MKKQLLVLVYVISSFSIFAQSEKTVFHNLGLTGAWGGWSYNATINNSSYNSFNGGIWGLEFGKTLLVGGLHYTVPDAAINSNYNLRTNSLYLAYLIQSYKPIHPLVSLAIGGGSITQNDIRIGNTVLVLQPAAGVEINALRVCHIDLQGGYRAALTSNNTTYANTNFSGFYAQLNLRLGFSWGHGTEYDKRRW